MSTTDDALDALDRRGRAAARTLLDDLAARTTPLHDPDAADPASASPAPPEPAVIRLDRPEVPGGRRPARRRFLAAAVVTALAAAGGAAAVVTSDDGDPDVTSGAEQAYLLPGWLPAGFAPVSAVPLAREAASGFGAEIAVYGDPHADDPWSDSVAVMHLVADEDLLGPLGDGDEVRVAGHDARVREAESEGPWGQGPTGPGWEVEWRVDDGRLIVVGALSRDDVLAAAETATAEPALDTSALPDGYTELARGPMTDSVLFTSLFEGLVDGSTDGPGLAVTYADPADNGAVRHALVVAQRPGPASAVGLLRLSFDDVDAITVRDRSAEVGRGRELDGSAGESGVVAVQWAESDGQLVTVVGFGVAEGDVLRVVGGMRAASAGEIAALRAEPPATAPREFGELPEGHVVAAFGDSPTGHWRIVADTRRQPNIGGLTIERIWGAIAGTASTTGDRVEPPLDLGADFSDGTVVVWGVLWVDAASVTVEAPGRDPVTLDIHEVDGWDRRVVAGAFPDDHFTGADGTVSVVARDADGQEVARNDTVLGSGG
jgi:hypothetical protein